MYIQLLIESCKQLLFFIKQVSEFSVLFLYKINTVSWLLVYYELENAFNIIVMLTMQH